MTFLAARPPLSTVLSKFSHIFISFGCHPLEGVTRGAPPSDITASVSGNDNHIFITLRECNLRVTVVNYLYEVIIRTLLQPSR